VAPSKHSDTDSISAPIIVDDSPLDADDFLLELLPPETHKIMISRKQVTCFFVVF
jgi:hypothetical protein